NQSLCLRRGQRRPQGPNVHNLARLGVRNSHRSVLAGAACSLRRCSWIGFSKRCPCGYQAVHSVVSQHNIALFLCFSMKLPIAWENASGRKSAALDAVNPIAVATVITPSAAEVVGWARA